MEEIKYRQRINGESYYWGFFKESNEDSFWKGPITTINPETKEPYPSEIYIEINDKHGKEIFVGDRIRAKVENNPPYIWVEGIVFYDDGEYCIEQEDDYFPVCSFHIIDRRSIEIVMEDV